MKPRFQPTPSRTSTAQKCGTLRPVSETPAAASISARPSAVTGSLPKRSISRPVTKLGAYMASTCHWMPRAAAATLWPQPTMASGAAVMTRLIKPNDTTPAAAAMMKRGVRAMRARGRPACAAARPTGTARSRLTTPSASSASAACETKLPAKGAAGHRLRVQMAALVPSTAATRPALMMAEMARGRCSGRTPSVTAWR
ncbi:Uncharacterised protein [Bordetella parapertussis]|nr:Uncharacterised protein [Bordetella parapertussis]SUV58828.1 Uncharacterised protein [Bordetella parapertussis]SUV79396.1 Uncharacterised protein [Bordetella parapertussis]VEF52533.1 Uncharacterised protein [Bordetella parapertussis]VTR30061.1 Uncharacterised protein [Bordetella parapertussis]